MQFVGKYSFVKKDKTGNIIDTYSQNNVITNNGRQQIFKLLSQSSQIGFNGMDGYQVLDLSTYNIYPAFDDGNNYISLQHGDIRCQFLPYDQRTDEYQSGQIFQDVKWDVQSSFFLRKKWTNERNLTNKTISTYKNTQNNTVVDKITYQYQDINNNGSISDKNVDNILKQNNNVFVNWKQINSDDSSTNRQFFKSVQNIDFYRVFCRQRIVTNRKNFIVPLWKGNVVGNNNNQMLVSYKIDLSQIANNQVKNNESISVCLVGKYKNLNYNEDFKSFNLSNGDILLIDIENGTATIKINQHLDDQPEFYEIILQYYVHYKDERLNNGICGMYLYYDYLDHYDYLDSNNDKNTFQLRNRDYFGNGVFSNNGGLFWDDNFCFPWNGRPIKHSDSSYMLYRASGNNYASMYWNTDQTDLLIMADNYNDSIKQRFFSFYPYVYKNPTQFQFLLSLKNSQIRVKNFLFLIPKFSPQVPSVFSFGDNAQTNQLATVGDTSLKNQLYRTNALQCVVNNDDSNTISIKWKTVLQFEDANDFIIKQVGINYSEQFLKQLYNNWYYLAPIDIQQCNKLFSHVVLDNAIEKNDEQTLQVVYELQIG